MDVQDSINYTQHGLYVRSYKRWSDGGQKQENDNMNFCISGSKGDKADVSRILLLHEGIGCVVSY